MDWKTYLKEYSSIKGLEDFVDNNSDIPYTLSEKPDALIIVQHEMLFTLNKRNNLPDYLALFNNIEKIITLNEKNMVYFSQTNPDDTPINSNHERLPAPVDIGFAFVIGCFGPACVAGQVESLSNRNYQTIMQVRKLIKGQPINKYSQII